MMERKNRKAILRILLLVFSLCQVAGNPVFSQVACLKEEAPPTPTKNFSEKFQNILKWYHDLHSSRETEEFEAENPYYIKYCVSSRFKHKPNQNIFGVGDGRSIGHFTLYLKGVAKDDQAPYPRLKMPTIPADMKVQDMGGVGVSADVPFKNVNFVVADKEFFFNANLGKNDVLDRERYLSILKEADKVYEGVDFHHMQWFFPPKHHKTIDRDYFKAFVLGSDYGISLGRYSYCLNMPVTKEIMGDVVAYLNNINDTYANYKNTGTKYRWNPFKNNCVHLGANLSCHLGVAGPRPTHYGFIWQLLHITNPANVLIELAHKANEGGIEPLAIFKDKKLREVFMKYKWLPIQHDSLIEIRTPTQLASNEVYDPRPDVYAFPKLLTRPYTVKGLDRHHFKTMFKSPRYINRRENFLFFKHQYLEALEKLAKIPKEHPKAARKEGFQEFAVALEAHLKEKLSQVETYLKQRSGDSAYTKLENREF